MKGCPADAPTPIALPGVNPVSLESVLCTEELKWRPTRQLDYATENRALTALTQALADSPRNILQTLVNTILETLHVDSAGISLLTADAKRFYWPAIAGVWQPYIGGSTPRDFGPCGDVLECNGPLLFKRLTCFVPVTPLGEECLLIPFYVKGEAVGIIWAVVHDALRKFDAEDVRQLESLGRFASAAYQATESLNVVLEHRRAAHSPLEDALESSQTMQRVNQELRDSEAFNRSIVESSPDCIKVLDPAGILLSINNGQALLGIADIQPFLNKSWIEFWNDDVDREAAQAAIVTAAAGGQGNFVGFFRTLRGEPKWWDVRISPILDAESQPVRLLAVSRDVTARRQSEMNFEFLAAISHDLVRFTGVDEMMPVIGAKIGAHFELSLCAFAEIDETAEQVAINHDWHRADVPSLVGVHHLADFVEGEFIRMARAGEIIIVRDTAADTRTTPEKFAALHIASFICVPLIRDGQWRFALCLYRSEAYAWREDEIELARELTVRIWTRLERLRAEQALRESQRFLRSSLDALSGHLAVLDEGGNILEVNEAWRRFVDANQFAIPDYGIGSSYLQLGGSTLPQESEAPAYKRGIADVIAGRQPRFELEYPCHSPTEQRWFVMRVTRFQSPGPVRIVIVHDNITSRKRTEDELRQSEARFRLMADSAPVLIWLSGIDTLCFWFNKTWLDYTGRSMEQEIGNGWAETVHPADLDRCLETYAAAFNARAPLSMEYRRQGRDGVYRWFLDIGVPRYAAEHEFTGYIGSCTDITAVKRAEAAMRKSEERYHTLFNAIDEGFCIIEIILNEQNQPIDYRFLEINPTFTKQTGLTDPVGKRIREIIPDIENHWIETYGNVALSGESIRFVNETAAMDGRWFDVYACRVGEPDNWKVAVIFNDITTRRHSQEALLQTHAALQTHAEELGRFNRIAVGRELRMIELKKEINELCAQQGQPERYPLEFERGR